MTNSQTDCAIFHTNFEEFHLVDREIESTCEELDKDKRTTADAAETLVTVLRLEAEGEDNKSTSGTVIETSRCLGAAGASGGGGAKYETFLEMTGLTQKSILTPSRILSNHRNVMKPKDVKYRNRVKAAVTSEKCANGYAGVATSPTVKYWTEPFL